MYDSRAKNMTTSKKALDALEVENDRLETRIEEVEEQLALANAGNGDNEETRELLDKIARLEKELELLWQDKKEYYELKDKINSNSMLAAMKDKLKNATNSEM